jgi:hypothetical protein
MARLKTDPQRQRPPTALRSITFLLILAVCVALLPSPTPVGAATLLSATFDANSNGFTYADDVFLGTAQPNYASGSYQSSGGYSGGGLQVSLGGIDGNAITGMSGGWKYTLDLTSAETGVKMSFRYKVTQSAYYEYDEHTRMMVSVDGTLYGRAGRNWIDHVSGDGASSQGNSNSFQPTTEWQQYEVYIGNLAAGSHTITLGGYNSHKEAADESSTIALDDVMVSSGSSAPGTTDVETLVGRVTQSQYQSYIQTLSNFGDRCRMQTSCSPYTSYNNAFNWVKSTLEGMGYTVVQHTFTYSGFSGTNLYATKVGSVNPDKMYMLGAHLDGRGGGGAADDDGSGVALLLETARQLAASDVQVDKSVRFIFWDNEEGGLYGSYGYVASRRSLQGIENPSGSGKYPEPTWLGLVQHDMVAYDHGVGTAGSNQSTYADLDVEWRAGTTKEADSKALALTWKYWAGTFAADYPANAYNYSTNTDDTPFQPYVASVSVRENRRSLTSGSNAEWINPRYHTANDLYANYSTDDWKLGSNAVRVTLGTVATLAGAHLDTTNDPPTANPQSVTTTQDTPVAITLTGSDPENDPLTFTVETNPTHGALSGTAPNLTYTPDSGYTGSDSFTFIVSDGEFDSDPATVSITVNAPGPTTVFGDDFESDKSWQRNPNGTDTATLGLWERGDPEDTNSSGPKQLGTTVSGSNDLVTGRLAGANSGSYDIDGGVTTMRSPSFALPSGKTITLSLKYYLAHGNNSSSADYLRVKVVGNTTVTALQELGATNDDDAAWATLSYNISSLAGQSVYLLIEAADASGSSLVEAAVDDVSVVAQ